MAEKTVAIINLSKSGRRFEVNGGEKDGKIVALNILPNQKAVEVPEAEAKWLLGSLPSGAKRFPELIDAASFRPETAKEKEAALAENARLLKENETLKAQLASVQSAKSSGGKK